LIVGLYLGKLIDESSSDGVVWSLGPHLERDFIYINRKAESTVSDGDYTGTFYDC